MSKVLVTIAFCHLLAIGASAAEIRHASGITAQLPEGWTWKIERGHTVLLPPESSREDDSPETYLFQIIPTSGARLADDPNVLAAMEAAVRDLVPALDQRHDPEMFRAGRRRGVAMSWHGTDAEGGAIRVRILAVIGEEFAGAIVAIGEPQQIRQRLHAINQIATSMRFIEPSHDASLVGRWNLAGSCISSIIFAQNGQCRMFDRSATEDSTEANQLVGRWYAANGALTIVTAQWTLSAEYRIDNGVLHLTGEGIDHAYQREK